MRLFRKAKVYIEGVGIKTTDLLFDTLTRGYESSADAEEIKIPSDAFVVPAFIDQHIHGVVGADASDGGGAVSVMAKALPSEGTAYFLPTTMTVGREALVSAVEAVGRAMGDNDMGAEILGVHLEGPFISNKHVGAQNPDHVRVPDIGLLQELVDASGGNIKMMTVAPELDGADKLIQYAKEHAIKVSIGHTDATYSEVEHAGRLGADCITHTFNAQRALHHREAGTVGAALMTYGMYAELIADCIHVSVPAMKLLMKCKPEDKLILVTDSIRAKNLPGGESELGGQKVTVRGGEARLSDGTLAGSVLKMNDAVKNLVIRCGASITQAVDCASANVAKHLGLFDEMGGIKIGKRASYTVLDKNFDCVMTIRDGKTIYDRNAEA